MPNGAQGRTVMSSRLRKWPLARQSAVAVSEGAGVRFLHIGGDAIQSAMRLSNPDRLELHYTRAMMGLLLFHPKPRKVLMIGLGGGSMARFLHKAFPRSRVTALDVSAEVVAAARRYFDFPADGPRLSVVLEDGATWVPTRPASADVILLDAFEDGAQVEALCSESFYTAAFAALTEPGVFVQNFMADDKKMAARCERIERAFGSRVIYIRAADRVNIIAFAFKTMPARFAWTLLRQRAAELEANFDLPGNHYLSSLKKLNASSQRSLILRDAADDGAD